MKIYIASDHGGFEYKEEIKKFLVEIGYEVEDMGNTKFDPDDDYPDFVIPLAEKVAFRWVRQAHHKQVQGELSFGIVLGRSGNGEAIAANKVKGIRAALCLNGKMAIMAREHNDANILSLGADYVDLETAKKIVEVFLKTPFSNEERHKRRLEDIKKIEANN